MERNEVSPLLRKIIEGDSPAHIFRTAKEMERQDLRMDPQRGDEVSFTEPTVGETLQGERFSIPQGARALVVDTPDKGGVGAGMLLVRIDDVGNASSSYGIKARRYETFKIPRKYVVISKRHYGPKGASHGDSQPTS